MTTATVQASPTEAEIRAAITEPIRHDVELYDALYPAIAPINDSDMALTRAGRDGWNPDFAPPEDHPGTFWADLTEDEGEELHREVEQAIRDVTATAREQLIEAITAVALRFAESHPDVPRGRYLPRNVA